MRPVAPEGFVAIAGTEQPGGAFEVEREGTLCVCKRLPPRAREEPWMRARLVAEGALLERLGGRGAPRHVGSGEDHAGPWIVMERVPWPSLDSRAGEESRGGPTWPAWLARAAIAAFEALSAVHGAGVVHGDLSPANVLVDTGAAHAVLVDFDLAVGAGMPPLPPGPFRGTLRFAAPEAARGEPLDRRSDAFALAASLLFVASGEPPRPETTPAAMLLAAAERSIEPWARRAAATLEPAMGRALVACCAFDPRERSDDLGRASPLA
ncbi:MAG TPA: protein kinase [Polyangiaceae bacterium]|jgi:serine/threonine protein kinase